MPTMTLLVGRSLFLILKGCPVPSYSSPGSSPKPRRSPVTASLRTGVEHPLARSWLRLAQLKCIGIVLKLSQTHTHTHNSTVRFFKLQIGRPGKSKTKPCHHRTDFSPLTPLFLLKEASPSHLSGKQSLAFTCSVAFRSHAQANTAATLF